MEQYFTNNENLESQRRVIHYRYDSNCFEFISDNGVFSKNKIDFGSLTLVETYLENAKDIHSFLDVGCGYGFISIVLSKILNVSGLGTDINKRALHLAQENAKNNQVSVTFKESNIYEKVDDKFDLIITNPPIRAGAKVVLSILQNAKEHLNAFGEIWCVIRKDQGAKSIMKKLHATYEVTLIKKNKGFFIFMLKNN